jgi:Major intrinsic protein
MPHRIAPKLLAEFIGTFAFVFIGAGAAAVVGTGTGLSGIAAIAFAHGLTIMAFAFAYGTVSGGHMNPAARLAHPGANEGSCRAHPGGVKRSPVGGTRRRPHGQEDGIFVDQFRARTGQAQQARMTSNSIIRVRIVPKR